MNNRSEILKQVEKDKDTLAIVEGQNDKKALERLGFTRVITLNKAVYKIVEEVCEKCKDVLILTDLDDEGKKKFSVLNSYFSQHGVRVNNKLRNLIFKHSKVRQIECLATYLLKEE